MKNKLMIVLSLLLMFFVVPAFAQNAVNFDFTMNASDGPNDIDLVMGFLDGAVDGEGPEDVLGPPPAPGTAFDARINNPDNDLLEDRRADDLGPEEFDLSFQAAENQGPVVFSWDQGSLPSWGTFQLQDITGAIVIADMSSGDNFFDTSTNTLIDLTGQAKIVITPMQAPAAPDIIVDPLTHDAGVIDVGNAATQTITITNDANATADLNVTSVAFQGGQSAEWSLDLQGLSGSPIAPGNSETFDITFTPVDDGVENASVDITSDDPDEGTVTVSCTAEGNVLAPEINVTPTTFSLGNVDIGNSASATITIENLGDATLTVSNVGVSTGTAEWSRSGFTSGTIAPAGSETFDVTFTPTDVGLENVTVLVFSDDADEPTVTVTGDATGTDPNAGVPNDLCADAITVTCDETVSGTTIGATFDDVGTCGTSNTAPGVWYHFVGTGDDVNVATCDQADFDTKISVFDGSCAALNCVGGNDDGAGCADFSSSFDFTSVAGVDYYILVHGFSAQEGNFDLTITCTPPPGAPENDLCVDAISVNCGDTVSGTTVGASVDDDVVPVDPCDDSTFPPLGVTAPGVWYSITGTGGNITASLCNQADYDTKISVYTGDCAAPPLTCVGGNDDGNGCLGFTSEFTWPTIAGEEYLILVHGYNDSEGNFDLSISCEPAPVVECDPEELVFDLLVDETGCQILNLANVGFGDATFSISSNDAPVVPLRPISNTPKQSLFSKDPSLSYEENMLAYYEALRNYGHKEMPTTLPVFEKDPNKTYEENLAAYQEYQELYAEAMEQLNGGNNNDGPAIQANNSSSNAVLIFEDNMDGDNSVTGLQGRGYSPQNDSSPLGVTDWFQGNSAVFDAFNGPADGYAGANFNNTAGTGTIDNWLMLPELDIQSGDEMCFYSRSTTSTTFPDFIRVMYNATGSTDVNDGSWVQLDEFQVNNGTWEQKCYQAPSNGSNARFAIRYYVENGGPTGSNSDYIGIDQITIDRPLPPCSWISSVTPSNGTISQDGSVDIEVCADATGLVEGSYNCLLTIDGNFVNGPKTVPLTLNVTELHNLTILADEQATLQKYAYVEGDIHSNDEAEYKRGTFHDGNVSAVSEIEVHKDAEITGTGTAPEFDYKGGASDANFGGGATIASVDPEEFPDVPPFTAGTEDIELEKGETRTLAPGSYGEIEVQDDATLNLSTGEYFIKSIEVGKRGVVNLDATAGPVDLYIEDELSHKRDSEFNAIDGPVPTKKVTIWVASSRSIKIRKRTIFNGCNLVAPYAKVKVQKSAFFRGLICAREVDVQKRAVLVSHNSSTEPKDMDVVLLNVGEELMMNTTAAIPTTYELDQNFPNPFNPTTTIRFGLPETGEVSLKVYNARGQLVRTLANGNFEAGYHNITWDAKLDNGSHVASGIYFYQILSKDFHQVKKMILLK